MIPVYIQISFKINDHVIVWCPRTIAGPPVETHSTYYKYDCQ